jgi:hypothetical protein
MSTIYAAQRTGLFTRAVQLFAWERLVRQYSEYGKVNLCLHGSGEVTLQTNLQFGYKYFFLFVIKYVYINST